MDCNLVSELFFYCNVSVPKCKAIAPHLTRYYDLTFVLDGSLTYVLDGKTCMLQKNDAMLVPPGTIRQRLAGTSPVSYVSFNFHAKDPAVLPKEVHMKNAISPAVRHMVSALPQKHLSPLFYTKEKPAIF